jgi:hypothetical protein
VAYTIITGDVISTDPNYGIILGSAIADVEVANTDNDTAGVTVSPISGLITTEGGGTATFTVVLNSEPTADVTIPLSSSNPNEGALSVTEVTFSTINWNTPQTITVTGVDDAVVDGSVDYTILTGDPTSADPVYNSLAEADIADVSVTNTDNDTAGVSINDITVNEGNGTATFTVTFIGNTLLPFSINYETENGTAIAGQDYTSISNSLTFAAGPGVQSRPISVDILPNTTVE